MIRKYMKKLLFTATCLLISMLSALGQQTTVGQGGGPSPEQLAEQEKKMDEFIYGEIEKLTRTLKLEDGQVFYVDSILNNDYRALQAELNSMGQARVANSDIYIRTRDKWAEQMFVSMKKVFNEEQWAKFLKSGAGKEKKARDKRAAKIAAAAAKNQGN